MTCAHCGAPLCQDGRRSTRRFCSGRCRQAGYRRRRQRLREDLSDPDPGGARHLRDREIVAFAAGAPASWLGLYRELRRLDLAMLRHVAAATPGGRRDSLPDRELIEAEQRRVRSRFRFWTKTMTSAPRAGAPGA